MPGIDSTWIQEQASSFAEFLVIILSTCAVCIVALVYAVDYYRFGHNHKSIKSEKAHSHLRGNLRERFFNPRKRMLHVYTCINFASTVIYNFSFAWQYAFTDTDDTPGFRTAMYLDTFLYAAAKFAIGAFFITRFQITSKELNKAKPWFVLFLWGINATSFVVMFVSAFSNPPQITYISDNAGIGLTVSFVVFDTLLHLLLLFQFIWPLSIYVRELKFRQSSTNLTVMKQEEGKRINDLSYVIRIAIFGCALSVLMTFLCNFFYMLAYYVNYDEENKSVWLYLYPYQGALEAVICSIVPLANYPRHKQMFKSTFCHEEPEVSVSVGTSGNKEQSKSKSNPSHHHTGKGGGTVKKRKLDDENSEGVELAEIKKPPTPSAKDEHKVDQKHIDEGRIARLSTVDEGSQKVNIPEVDYENVVTRGFTVVKAP